MSAITTDAELVEIPKATRQPFEIWATIKKTSKYYNQNRIDPHDPKRKVYPFKIDAIQMSDLDGYDFKGGLGGQYRREDLQLFIKGDNGEFKKI